MQVESAAREYCYFSDGSVEARDSVTGCANNAKELGLELADRLKKIGAIEILKLAR